MVDLCVEAGNAVMQSGSDEMKCATRLMLLTLADDIAQHERASRAPTGIVTALPRRGRPA